MTTLAELKHQIETCVGLRVNLKVNDNRSTMLSVRRGSKELNLSIHRMFLQAPKNVLEALTTYIRNNKKTLPISVRHFIDQSMASFDYSHRIDVDKMQAKGRYFDLAKELAFVNESYFQGRLNLNITWYGDRFHRSKSQATFGLYVEGMRLIKIHRRLDQEQTPQFLVNFIVYHEALHHLYRPEITENGARRVHTKNFLEEEKKHTHYLEATEWIKNNTDRFFYGRS